MIDLQHLNEVSAGEFTELLTGIFEHSPWVAARAALQRPFASRQALLEALCAVVDAASAPEQLTLIRAHPQLGTKRQAQARLTAASAREQRGAGLAACTPQEYARLEALNAAYVEKFEMPFILAVRGHVPESIIADVEARLGNDPATERSRALHEIASIAGFRLADAVSAA